MKSIDADTGLVADVAGDPVLPNGSQLQDQILASYRKMTAYFGQPTLPDGDGGYKTYNEWRIATPDGVAAIYDYKHGHNPADEPDKDIHWHIGAANRRAAWWINLAVSDQIVDRRRRATAGHVTAEDAKAAARAAAVDIGDGRADFRQLHAINEANDGGFFTLQDVEQIIDGSARLRWQPHHTDPSHRLAVTDADNRLLHFEVQELSTWPLPAGSTTVRTTWMPQPAPQTPLDRLAAAHARFEENNEDPDGIDDPASALALATAVAEFLRQENT